MVRCFIYSLWDLIHRKRYSNSGHYSSYIYLAKLKISGHSMTYEILNSKFSLPLNLGILVTSLQFLRIKKGGLMKGHFMSTF